MDCDDNIVIFRKDNVEAIHKNEHADFEYFKYCMPNCSDQSNLQIAVYEIPPLKSGYPYHYHLRSEEVFFIIDGVGSLRSETGQRKVGKGDIIICPPGEKGAHILTNTSQNEVLTYFEVDLAVYPEIIKYPDTKKVGMFEKKGTKMFFKEKDEVTYYD